MSYETLLLEVDEGIATVVVNRPEKRNALNATVRRELAAALGALGADDAVRVVVITGAGEKAFIAGADIAEFGARTAEEQRAVMSPPTVFDAVADLPQPTIAMINGFALGGGGTQRLARLVGSGQTLRLVLTGALVDAAEALRIGMVDAVHPDVELRTRTYELARAMAAHSPVALRIAKQAVRAAYELPLAAGLARERELFIDAFRSDDGREGVSAFLEKRTPAFRGR